MENNLAGRVNVPSLRRLNTLLSLSLSLSYGDVVGEEKREIKKMPDVVGIALGYFHQVSVSLLDALERR